MSIFVSEFQDVSIHSCSTCSFFIVPFQINTRIFSDLPIFGDVVIFLELWLSDPHVVSQHILRQSHLQSNRIV